MKRPWLLLVLLAAAVPAAAADLYTWTDANGVKHFSDSPPPANAKAEKLRLAGGVTNSDSAEAARDGQESGPNAPLAAAAGYTPEEIKRHCETAKRNLATLDAQPPAADGNADLHREQVEKTHQQIKLFCGG